MSSFTMALFIDRRAAYNLGVFANIAKFLKPLSQRFRPTGGYAVHHKEVWAFSIAAMIFAPGAVEAAPVHQAEVMSEVIDGLSVSRQGLNEGIDQRMTAPLGESVRIDRGTEVSGSSGEPALAVDAQSYEATKASGQKSAADNVGIGDDSLDQFLHGVVYYGLIAVWVIWLSCGDPWGGLGNPYDRR